MTRKRHTGKRLFMLAAAIALAAALSGIAIAANFLGLRDALLPEPYSVNKTDENGVVIPGEYEYQEFISLSGYSDTPESQALAEWQSFLEGYDQDGSILASVGNNPTGFEERYGMYLIYTQEMADKLEEIIAKYGLKLHSWFEAVLPEAWPECVGNFLKEPVRLGSGYIYENGTFRFDGDAVLDGYGVVDFQFSRSVKGTFDDVTLNVGSLSDFEEWSIRTEEGISLTLGLGSRNRSLILADLGDSFILVNVLAGREADDTFSSGAIGREELERLANRFDYSALTPVKEPERTAIQASNARYQEALENQPLGTLPSESKDLLYTRTGIQEDTARAFIQLLAEDLDGDKREEIADLLAYPVRVETADGTVTANTPEEFLEHYDETIGQNRLSLLADMTWDPSIADTFSDGSGLVSTSDGAVWFGLVEDGVIRVFTLQTDQWSIRPAEGVAQG